MKVAKGWKEIPGSQGWSREGGQLIKDALLGRCPLQPAKACLPGDSAGTVLNAGGGDYRGHKTCLLQNTYWNAQILVGPALSPEVTSLLYHTKPQAASFPVCACLKLTCRARVRAVPLGPWLSICTSMVISRHRSTES